MKQLYVYVLIVFSISLLCADDHSLLRNRLGEINLLKSKEFTKWPQRAVLLYQGLHYKLNKPVQNLEDHLSALALIPQNLKQGHYKPTITIEKDGWYLTKAGISVIASEKGSDLLFFGYQW